MDSGYLDGRRQDASGTGGDGRRQDASGTGGGGRRLASGITRARRALGWRFLTLGVRVVLQLVVICVLSRLLSVDDFGLVMQAMIVIGFLTTFSEVGMAPVLIQKRNVSDGERDTAFSLAIIAGILICVAVWLTAPLVAWSFDSPGVTAILRGMGFCFLFASPGTTTAALLQRELDFKTLFKVDSLAYLLGYAVPGIVLALLDFGPWSLVAATLGQSVLQLVFVFWFSKTRRPKPRLHRENVRGLWGSASGYSVARLIFYAARNADFTVLAALVGSFPLGLYSRAYQLMTIPISRFSGVINTVLFPAFSRWNEEQPDEIQRRIVSAIQTVACVLFPTLAIMSTVGQDLVVGLLGEKWAAAGRPFQLLCAGGLFLTVHNLLDTFARSQAWHTARCWRHLVYLGLAAGSTWLLTGRGLTFVAAGIAGVMCVQYVLMAALLVNENVLTWRRFFVAQRTGFVLAICGAGFAALATQVRLLDSALPIVRAVVAGALAIVGCLGIGFFLPVAWLPDVVRPFRTSLEKRWKKGTAVSSASAASSSSARPFASAPLLSDEDGGAA